MATCKEVRTCGDGACPNVILVQLLAVTPITQKVEVAVVADETEWPVVRIERCQHGDIVCTVVAHQFALGRGIGRLKV